MSAHDRLRDAIAARRSELRRQVPASRAAAAAALVHWQDRLALSPAAEAKPDPITGRQLPNLGVSVALALCLEAEAGGDELSAGAATPGALDGWADSFIADCARLAEAETALGHVETGFMRLVDDGHGHFAAWIARKRSPVAWRERAEIDWWAAWLAKRDQAERAELERQLAGDHGPGRETIERRLVDIHLRGMAWQPTFPPQTTVAGCAMGIYQDALRSLVEWAVAIQQVGAVAEPWPEAELVARVAARLSVDAAVARHALAAFTLDRENAAYHAAVPGVAAAPLVRVDANRIVLSAYGALTEPLLFLARELRRRDPQGYHNAAILREEVFRQELYALFADRRFVTSAGRVELRRERGDVRTDVDAVVFDRKTGTLGLFELKSQDPFPRTSAELARQRDNVLYANRQIAGALDWLKRHGGDELLRKVDQQTAKRFRVQRVLPFVLGRYVARFDDGPEPDRRVAWGTWPQVLRLTRGEPFAGKDANPLASLHNRLLKDVPSAALPGEETTRETGIGDARLIVYPSYRAFQRQWEPSGTVVATS